MNPALTRDCPHCKLPGQMVNLNCSWCGHHIPLPDEAMAGVGDSASVEEVIGYRAWNVVGRGPRIRLHSPLYTYVWNPGGDNGDGWFWAQCEGAGKIGHARVDEHRNDAADPNLWVPVRHCGGRDHGCGFYAGRTHAHLIDLGYARAGGSTVIGRIQMQGKIIPATNGFRAQQVKILEIFVPHHLWELNDDLEAAYSPDGTVVGLHTVNILDKEDAPEWCEHCSASMPPRSFKCRNCGYNHIHAGGE